MQEREMETSLLSLSCECVCVCEKVCVCVNLAQYTSLSLSSIKIRAAVSFSYTLSLSLCFSPLLFIHTWHLRFLAFIYLYSVCIQSWKYIYTCTQLYLCTVFNFSFLFFSFLLPLEGKH